MLIKSILVLGISLFTLAQSATACEMSCYPKQIASFDRYGKGIYCVKCIYTDCRDQGEGLIRTFKFEEKAKQPGHIGIKYLCVNKTFESEP